MEMASTQGSYYKNGLHGSPVVRNWRMRNYDYWAFFKITLININYHERRYVKYTIVLKPYHLGNRFWCLYLGFDCQGRRLNENQACMITPHKSNMAAK